MRRKIAVAMSLLTIFGSCAAPETGVSPPVIVLESPQPTPFPEGADIGDGGLLSGLPCAAPCVYGIRIGETQLEQVIPMLEQNGLSECQREESASWIGIVCGYRVIVQVDRATSLVNATGFYPSASLALGDIIETYGEPDFVSFRVEDSPDGRASRISLFWDTLKMIVEMPQIKGHRYALEEMTSPEAVYFSDDVLYHDSTEVEFGAHYKRWNGYGLYRP